MALFVLFLGVAAAQSVSSFLNITCPDQAPAGTPLASSVEPWGIAWNLEMTSMYVTTSTLEFHAPLCLRRYDKPALTLGCWYCSTNTNIDVRDLIYFKDSNGIERLFAGSSTQGVKEYDPNTCQFLFNVSTGFASWGLRRDPISGDIFYSQNNVGIQRFPVPAQGAAAVTSTTLYYSAPGKELDGIHFGQDGRLYLSDVTDEQVVVLTATNSANPGTVAQLIPFPSRSYGGLDGISTCGQNLVVNSNGGYVTTYTSNQWQVLYHGPYRGDWATTGDDGCVYSTYQVFTNPPTCTNPNGILRGPCGCDSDAICTPSTSCPVGKNCGTMSDGCGGTINCGSCSAPGSCTADNVCGSDPCESSPCSDPNAICTNNQPPATGRTCTCATGYVGSADGTNCVDYNACCNFPCSSGQTCVDLRAPAPADASGRSCEACTTQSSATSLTLTSSTTDAVRGSSVTFTATLHFASTTPPAATTANFVIAQQGNNRAETCVKQTLTSTSTSIVFTCVTTTLPLGDHKYHAEYSFDGGCLAPAKSPLVKIHIRNH